MRLRSLLFVPAVRPDFFSKLAGHAADGFVIDCEDATPAEAKAEARENVRRLAPGLAARGRAVFVRINGVASSWFREDVAEGLVPELAGVVVPKIDRLEHVDAVGRALGQAGLSSLPIVAGIETALGVAEARALVAAPGVAAAYFGAEDFVSDMRGVRTERGLEVAYARARVALACRLAGVAAIDQAVVDFRDAARFEREVRAARALGYAGKLCVHPGQVPLANAGFLPSKQEVDHASRLLEAYEIALASGIAAIDFEGQMVDEPVAARARLVLSTAGSEAGEDV